MFVTNFVMSKSGKDPTKPNTIDLLRMKLAYLYHGPEHRTFVYNIPEGRIVFPKNKVCKTYKLFKYKIVKCLQLNLFYLMDM